MPRILYKPISLAASLAGGALAGALFRRLWKLASGEDEAPKATDSDRGWAEILIAAGLQGAVFAIVRAAVDRGAPAGTRKLTGSWPGDGTGRDDRPQDASGSAA
jgi:hypothetical protein